MAKIAREADVGAETHAHLKSTGLHRGLPNVRYLSWAVNGRSRKRPELNPIGILLDVDRYSSENDYIYLY